MHVGLHHAEAEAKKGIATSFDRFMVFIGILGPLSLVPQVWKIWEDRSIAGISIISWILLSIFSFLWLLYGIIHRSKALIVSNAFSIVLNLLVVAGILVAR